MTKALKQAQVERCVDNMLGMLNNAALAQMTSIGQRTKLCDMIPLCLPSMSAQSTAAAGWHERYVHVVNYEPLESRLPLHRNALTGARHAA
jgi:hypothetical protein